ncbi:MAG TPA: hypothetical protein DCS93_09415 [Microscillaceae bacterium]|nr:hypothetical protein [Microscillaceae bacterium]
MKNQKTLAEKIVRSIANKLLAETPTEVGLYNGASGIALFLAYYYLYTKEDRYGEKAAELLSGAVENPTQSGTTVTLYKGAAGVGWVVQHLANIGFLDEEITTQLNGWDDLIFNSMMSDLANRNYDLMHGAIGKGVYFIERLAGNTNTQQQITSLTEGILNLAYQNNQEIYWTLNGNPKTTNVGMAHGMASIMRYLGEAYKLNIYPEACKKAIQGAFDWFWARELSGEISKFSAEYDLENLRPRKGSALYWCHGDLGVLTLLGWMTKHIPEVLRKNDLDKFQELLLFESNRSLENSGMAQSEGRIESIFCHGLAGTGYIFHQLTKISKLQALNSASDYWLELLVQEWKAQNQDYQTRHGAYQADGSVTYYWKNDIFLHNGIAGIAIVLLQIFLNSRKQKREWDFYAFTDL